jgi:hypothetical protein
VLPQIAVVHDLSSALYFISVLRSFSIQPIRGQGSSIFLRWPLFRKGTTGPSKPRTEISSPIIAMISQLTSLIPLIDMIRWLSRNGSTAAN